MPFLPPRSRAQTSRFAIPVGTPSQPDDDGGGGGLFGLGVGPDINLGVGTALRELGQAGAALTSMVLPGSKEGEIGLLDFAKGFGSSMAGTVIAAGESTGLLPALDVVSPLDDTAGDIRGAVGQALGSNPEEELALTPVPLMTSVRERGLLPTAIEHVGNVSILAGAATAPAKAGSVAAKMAGRTEMAARFEAAALRTAERPLIRAARHPYRTAGRAFIERATKPAQARLLGAANIVDTPPHLAPIDYLAQELPDTGVDYQQVRVDMQEHAARAEAYRNLPADDPEAHAAYEAFRDEINEQYRHLTEDLGVVVEVVDEDPYPSNVEMLADLRDNRTLKVLRTEEDAHPFLTAEENDKFRAVHDAYGHGATGRDFGRHGEEAAFLAHRSMLGEDAGQAMATETRGQNSVLIDEGEFGDQKVGLLPEELADATGAVAKYQRKAPRPGDEMLARLQRRIDERDLARQIREQNRLAESEKRIASRSPAIRSAVAAARDHIIDAAAKKGIRISRREASIMVGDELHARMTGTKVVEDHALSNGVTQAEIVELGIRERFIPTELLTPELETALLEAVDANITERATAREILESGRKGATGLPEEGATEPTLTKAEKAKLNRAQKLLDRAESEVLDRKEAREVKSREKYVAAQEDKLGRIAEQARRLDEEGAQALDAFEHSRSWTPRAWRGAGALERSAVSIYERTMEAVAESVARGEGEAGGATFNPHSGTFVIGGSGPGFALGVVPGTALAVPLAEFSPADIAHVVQAYQDVYQLPNTTIGTWVEDGKVYIDPGEIVQSRPQALVRAAAREQLSSFDIGANDVVAGILKDRPDIAKQFLDRHTHLDRRYKELQEIVRRSPEITDADADKTLDLLMRQAVAAVDNGLVKHPDQFFRDHVRRFDAAEKRSTRPGALAQIVLERTAGTPKERAALWKEVTAKVKDIEQVRGWYFKSHELVERQFRNQADVTLLDGTKINPADLMYQIVAITSFQAMPRDNWTRAMSAFQRFDDLPRKEMKELTATLRKVTAGKATLEEAFGLGVGMKLADDNFSGFGLYDTPRQYLAELFSGRTIDTWTPEYLAEVAPAMGRKEIPYLDRARALEFIDAEHPGLVERIGEDAAIKEFYSRNHRAKIITFWDNLANPEKSLGVTMDQVMERVWGVEFPLKQTPTGAVNDAWIRYSEQIRDMADELSELTGERIMPHELQALLWVFGKEEIQRIAVGHFNALANDAVAQINAGQPLDAVDPIGQWLDESGEPYTAEGNRQVRQWRILRDETEPPTTKPPISHGQSPLDYGIDQPVLRMEVRDPSAGPSRDLAYADDPQRTAFIDYTPNLNKPGEVYIHFMSTRPEARGQGLSRALTEELYRLTGKDEINFGDIEAPEVEVLRRKMAEAHPEKGNHGTPADGIVERADEHMNTTAKAGQSEDVTILAGTPQHRRTQLGKVEKRRSKWEVARADINASLAAGDIDTAMKTFNKYADQVRGTGPLGLLEPEAGADFFDIWMDKEGKGYHTPAYLEAAQNLDRLDVRPGEFPLFQAFKDKVLGEFVPMDDGTRGVIRIFEDGNLATLVHENGHLLRRILNEGQMRAVEGAYGITDGRWTVAHEEAFANDLLNYMSSNKAPAGLGTTFQRVREALSNIWHMVSGTMQRRRVHPELADVFDAWLNPAVKEVDAGPYPGLKLPEPERPGTTSQRVTRPPRLPKQATKGDYYQSGRRGAKALAKVEKLAARKRELTKAAAQVQQTIDDVRTVLAEGKLPTALERDALVREARQLQDGVNESLGRPSASRVPAHWQPIWQATQTLAKEAETNPELAAAMAEFPETFHEIQQLAISKGFDPTHVRDFTPAQVRRLVFGTMRLGMGRDLLNEASAGTRKSRAGVLAKAGTVDRSIESFMAATVEAIAEKRTNEVITWVEQNVARNIERGQVIPPGWAMWDPVRSFLLTGENVSDGVAQATAGTKAMIVPEPVIKTLNRYSKDYDHWAFNAIRKVTSPWRTLVLTLSPGWYVRNVVGNIVLATAEGVTLKDWKAAWHTYKSKDEIGKFAELPWVTSDTLAQEAGVMADDALIPRRGLREATQEGGKIRGTAQYAARRMLRANEVVDEFARAAVYHRGRRLNMSPEAAMHRAKEALVDYNALSPFERSAVRAVIPFYAWQKGILKVTVNQALDHPGRVAVLALLGRMQEEYIADRFGLEPGDIPDYYKHLVGDRNVRSFNPFSDPSEIVTVEGVARSMNPFIELAIRKGMGAPEFYSDDRRLGYFGQPQQDVDVPSELLRMGTRSPGGRILGDGPGLGMLGLQPVDEAQLKTRFLKSRRTIRGISNPESGQGGGTSLLPPRLR